MKTWFVRGLWLVSVLFLLIAGVVSAGLYGDKDMYVDIDFKFDDNSCNQKSVQNIRLIFSNEHKLRYQVHDIAGERPKKVYTFIDDSSQASETRSELESSVLPSAWVFRRGDEIIIIVETNVQEDEISDLTLVARRYELDPDITLVGVSSLPLTDRVVIETEDHLHALSITSESTCTTETQKKNKEDDSNNADEDKAKNRKNPRIYYYGGSGENNEDKDISLIHATSSSDIHAVSSSDIHAASSSDIHAASSSDIHAASSSDIHAVSSSDDVGSSTIDKTHKMFKTLREMLQLEASVQSTETITIPFDPGEGFVRHDNEETNEGLDGANSPNFDYYIMGTGVYFNEFLCP